MCVVTQDRTYLKLNCMGAIKEDDKEFILSPLIKYIKSEGVYMFGGVSGGYGLNRNVNNKLFHLPMGKGSKHRWQEVKT